MAPATVFLALPKLSPITDDIAIILKILLIIAIKNLYTDNGNPSCNYIINNTIIIYPCNEIHFL